MGGLPIRDNEYNNHKNDTIFIKWKWTFTMQHNIFDIDFYIVVIVCYIFNPCMYLWHCGLEIHHNKSDEN